MSQGSGRGKKEKDRGTCSISDLGPDKRPRARPDGAVNWNKRVEIE